MEWYVLRENVNTQKIIAWNVFKHGRFKKSVEELLDRCKVKADFAEALRREVLYEFWGRCEYEVLVSGWPATKDGKEVRKIDVATQLEMNFDHFVDYLWTQ